MIFWIGFLSVAGASVLLMWGAYGALAKRDGHIHHDFLHGKLKRGDKRSTASRFELDLSRGMRAEPNQAPWSVYLGQVWVFDSVEHRDMFEANRHEPVVDGLGPSRIMGKTGPRKIPL